MSRKEKAPKTGLTTKHWFGYMFGDWGGCLTFTLMASIFGLYCTNVLGINPTLMGTLTLIWTIWDAINAPMMGALMDKAFAKHQTRTASSVPGCCVQLPCWQSPQSACGPFPPSWKASPC